MTITKKNLALEELKKELEKSKKAANEEHIFYAVHTLENAVNDYSCNTGDYQILNYIDKFIHYDDVANIIIEKAKNEGLYSVVWFLEEIDKYNCDYYYYMIDDVFQNLKEIDAGDVLDIISDVLDYLETK